EELTTLPGVGRKTANVIQAVAFKKAALAVDTHVFRVSHRLGLVPARCTTPYSVEMALRKYIPEAEVAASHYWILLHGRYTCTARNPKCQTCGLQAVCKEFAKRKE
ncbi:MAG: endonuclease III, partial [Bacteroidales bacterium]|nr:endonuclease III [Bacteroidales bacterium]